MDSFCWLPSGGELAYSILLHKLPNLVEELFGCEDSSEMQRFFVFLIVGSYFSQADG
jgi:hypothetical protein